MCLKSNDHKYKCEMNSHGKQFDEKGDDAVRTQSKRILPK